MALSTLLEPTDRQWMIEVDIKTRHSYHHFPATRPQVLKIKSHTPFLELHELIHVVQLRARLFFIHWQLAQQKGSRGLGHATKSQKAYWAGEDTEVMTQDFKKEESTSNFNINLMVFLMHLGKVYFIPLYKFCICFVDINFISIRKS